MFKAPIKVASHSAISNKDRKKLKKDLTKDFPTDAVDMFFMQTEEISMTKLQGSPVTIFSNEDFALFVAASGEGDYFPSSRSRVNKSTPLIHILILFDLSTSMRE